VLWDVDRTLLHVEGVSRLVYEDAFLAVVGRPLEHLADMAGRTDRYIITTTLELHGVEDADGLLEPFYRELGRAVRVRRTMLREYGRALAGASEALDGVAQVPGVVQSVVTGNTREIASEKLSAFGLDGHLDLEVGG
jgi:phosphoglycolate phosphatase-like HAD superfamily hydrolase